MCQRPCSIAFFLIDKTGIFVIVTSRMNTLKPRETGPVLARRKLHEEGSSSPIEIMQIFWFTLSALAAAMIINLLLDIVRKERMERVAQEILTTPQPLPEKSLHSPHSTAEKICGRIGERATRAFSLDDSQFRVTCGEEEGEPFFEIAERQPADDVLARVTKCIDLKRDDVPDACGTNQENEGLVRMQDPPERQLASWFRDVLQKVKGKLTR